MAKLKMAGWQLDKVCLIAGNINVAIRKQTVASRPPEAARDNSIIPFEQPRATFPSVVLSRNSNAYSLASPLFPVDLSDQTVDIVGLMRLEQSRYFICQLGVAQPSLTCLEIRPDFAHDCVTAVRCGFVLRDDNRPHGFR